MGALGATVGQIMRDRFGLPDDEHITRAWSSSPSPATPCWRGRTATASTPTRR